MILEYDRQAQLSQVFGLFCCSPSTVMVGKDKSGSRTWCTTEAPANMDKVPDKNTAAYRWKIPMLATAFKGTCRSLQNSLYASAVSAGGGQIIYKSIRASRKFERCRG